MHGGIAQGIAQALYEEGVYDDDGNLLTTTLADYLVPSAADLPSYVTDRTETPATQPARRQGRRRGGHDRVHPGGGQRDRGRAAAARHQRHHDAVHAGAGLAGDPGAGNRGGSSGRQMPRETSGRQRRRGMIPASFDYVRPGVARRGGPGAGRRRRGRQGHRRRAEPAAAAAAAAGLPGPARRRRRPRRAARRQRRRRRAADRRQDHALPAGARSADRRALRAAGAGGGHGRRPGGPAPRHARRLARARRPGR